MAPNAKVDEKARQSKNPHTSDPRSPACLSVAESEAHQEVNGSKKQDARSNKKNADEPYIEYEFDSVSQLRKVHVGRVFFAVGRTRLLGEPQAVSTDRTRCRRVERGTHVASLYLNGPWEPNRRGIRQKPAGGPD